MPQSDIENSVMSHDLNPVSINHDLQLQYRFLSMSPMVLSTGGYVPKVVSEVKREAGSYMCLSCLEKTKQVVPKMVMHLVLKSNQNKHCTT